MVLSIIYEYYLAPCMDLLTSQKTMLCLSEQSDRTFMKRRIRAQLFYACFEGELAIVLVL